MTDFSVKPGDFSPRAKSIMSGAKKAARNDVSLTREGGNDVKAVGQSSNETVPMKGRSYVVPGQTQNSPVTVKAKKI